MNLHVEALTLFSMLVAGVVMGMALDTYQVLKLRAGIKGWLLYLCDLLYWLSFTFVVFGTLIRVNEGVVRAYIFLAISLGFLLHFLIIHTWYVRFFHIFINFLGSVYRFLQRLIEILIVMPVQFVIRMITVLILFVVDQVWRGILLLKRLLILLLQPLIKAVTSLAKKLLKRKNSDGEREEKEGFLTRMTKWFKRKK